MKVNSKINKQSRGLCTTQAFIGESLEDKVRRTTTSNAPIEAISPMIYTERKDGVKKEYNIRTDKWEVAMEAMDTIAQGTRQKRAEKHMDKPASATEMNAQS